VTVTGGSGSYTYLWSKVSGTTLGINNNLTASAYCSYGGSAGTYQMIMSCTVYDTVLGVSATSNNVTATITLTQ
jgi:hypothetical protein